MSNSRPPASTGLPEQRGTTQKMPEAIDHGADGQERAPVAATGPEAAAAVEVEAAPPAPARAGEFADDATCTAPDTLAANPVAAMRNLYTAALSYNGYTITDGALRLIGLLHATDLG